MYKKRTCRSFFCFLKSKSLRGIALRRNGIVSVVRPAVGGESRKRDSLFLNRKHRFLKSKSLRGIALRRNGTVSVVRPAAGTVLFVGTSPDVHFFCFCDQLVAEIRMSDRD